MRETARAFLHTHPYEPFLFEGVTKCIVGTLPPPRFTTGQLKEGDVDFCYGSRDGQLWTILDRIFGLGFKYENTPEAVVQRKRFLQKRKIGICDIVSSARRQKVDASDIGMADVELRDLISYLYEYPTIHTLLFTGGNSKNGPEYFFRRLLQQYEIPLVRRNSTVPRVHEFILPVRHTGIGGEIPGQPRKIRTVSLIAPSGAANRAVGSLRAYKEMKAANPHLSTVDFRVLQYKTFF